MPPRKKAAKKAAKSKTIASLNHDDATRKNIPSAEMQQVISDDVKNPVKVSYPRGSSDLEEEMNGRNTDLDPQLVWRGKSTEPLEVPAPPLFIQEKVHPKALIDDLLRQSKARAKENAVESGEDMPDLFADFNGLPKDAKSTDFYQHEGHWQNRMILGDSLQVMASLSEREGLRGKVQCIYFDPPYGIKFNSNFQWSTTSRDVKDGKADHISREPEQVKAFRDTWRDGIHSYLDYLRDRLIVAKDLLTESGSIFVQIGDENVHRVRTLMDEVFGEENFVSQIVFQTTSGFETSTIASVGDHLLWFSSNKQSLKVRHFFDEQPPILGQGNARWVLNPDQSFRGVTAKEKRGESSIPNGAILYKPGDLQSQNPAKEDQVVNHEGREYRPKATSHWKANYPLGMNRLKMSARIHVAKNSLQYRRKATDFPMTAKGNVWTDTITGSFTEGKVYIVQTNTEIVQRSILMATDPGDLVLDPTCGSGTTAAVAEQWGRRWITIDTSRVALALARARIMGGRHPFYLLADSKAGKIKEAELTRTAPVDSPSGNNIAHGFVYERVPHITLKSIANNAEIDVIWEDFQTRLEPLREEMNSLLKEKWEEWEIPREAEGDWSTKAKSTHALWWEERIARQKEIDASIAAKADSEYLYDKPYEDKSKVRVAGPFTVESISPHRTLTVDENDEVVDGWSIVKEDPVVYNKQQDFGTVILENLKTAGVQQAHKEDRITFSSIKAFPGTEYICGEGTYTEGESDDAPQKRAGIFIGPEFGTVSRPDLVAAAREAGDLGFDVLIACAFNYDAHSSEFEKLGRIPVLKARMNADLHMAGDLKNTGKGNLFVIFGEPDIDIQLTDGEVTVKILGVDVFKPQTGEVVSSGPEGIACWFIDTDYNEESFFVRHAYFLGQNDPYKSLKTTLKSEIDPEAWESLNSDTSRPFSKPSTGRIAVKVINHLGDEVMKVFSV